MTEAVVVFTPGAVEAAVDAVCTALESHMEDFTDVAKRQFVKRVCERIRHLTAGSLVPRLDE
jgi:hypothetical protein